MPRVYLARRTSTTPSKLQVIPSNHSAIALLMRAAVNGSSHPNACRIPDRICNRGSRRPLRGLSHTAEGVAGTIYQVDFNRLRDAVKPHDRIG